MAETMPQKPQNSQRSATIFRSLTPSWTFCGDLPTINPEKRDLQQNVPKLTPSPTVC
jgi:hypothetical protein